MAESDPRIVRIELQRIQTYLFAVPRLRAMLGANAQLGHVIRHALPTLGADPKPLVLNWPEDIELPADTRLAKPASNPAWTYADNPQQALENGVLSRDGGHLSMVFPDQNAADAFCRVAREHLARTLPGLLVSIDSHPAQVRPPRPGAFGAGPIDHPVELPQLQVCTRSGQGIATEATNNGDYISAETQTKETTGEAFQKAMAGKPTKDKEAYCDYISLLHPSLPSAELEPAHDLEDLADRGGYIALIHADGNRVGRRIKAYETDKLGKRPKGADPHWLKRECTIEAFFHSMRVAVREAFIEALEAVFTDEVLAEHDCLPYQPLMLGGDDLLLICQPRYALDLVRAYAAALDRKDRHLPDRQPLSIGAGVVIAKHSLPFHRLHQIAESLAASAKRRFLQRSTDHRKNQPLPQRSVVDWTVLTSSWGEDPIEQRRRHDLIRYADKQQETTLALTAKPYFVLDKHAPQGNDGRITLESLLRHGKRLEAIRDLPRSQLKEQLRSIRDGRKVAELAYRELLERLPDEARTEIATLCDSKTPWQATSEDDHRCVTPLPDLIECLEMRFLGRRKQEIDHA